MGVWTTSDEEKSAYWAKQNKAQKVVGTQTALATGSVNAATAAGQANVQSAQGVLADATAAGKTSATAAADINKLSGKISGVADEMSPVIDALRGDAAQQRATSAQQRENAQPWQTSSQDLLNMNRDAGGTAGEYWRLYDQLDPSLQMALAASDARNETQAQTESAIRALTRAGVSPSAAAISEMRTTLANRASALVSAVKTKARQAGVQLQMGALEQGMKMALEQAGLAEAWLRDSVTATQGAVSAEAAAASAAGTQGGLYGKSGELAAQAASTEQAGAAAEVSAQNALTAANANWQSSLQNATEYYSTQASSLLGLYQEGYNAQMLNNVMGKTLV